MTPAGRVFARNLCRRAAARLEGLSAGPWRAGTHDSDAVFMPYPEGLAGPCGERVLLRMNKAFDFAADIAFVAACRTGVPMLVAYLTVALDALDAADAKAAEVKARREASGLSVQLEVLGRVLDAARDVVRGMPASRDTVDQMNIDALEMELDALNAAVAAPRPR